MQAGTAQHMSEGDPSSGGWHSSDLPLPAARRSLQDCQVPGCNAYSTACTCSACDTPTFVLDAGSCSCAPGSLLVGPDACAEVSTTPCCS